MSGTTRPHLTIDSHVVVQLGTELISDAEQALLELVKNSYDGDAKVCRIHVEPNWQPEPSHPWREHLDTRNSPAPALPAGRIRVRDNGSGLSDKQVVDGWLTISASQKRAGPSGVKPKTPGGRVPVGDKGLGRLATMRLGDVLMLRTMNLGEAATRLTSFAWSEFGAGVKLEDVPVRQGRGQAFSDRKKGTDVEILGLGEAEYWRDRANVGSVVARLSTLITPFRQFKDFKVVIRDDHDTYDLQEIAAELLNHAAAKFTISYTGGRVKLKGWFARTLFRGARGREKREEYERLLSEEALPKALAFIGSQPGIASRGFEALTGEVGGWLFSMVDEIAWEDLPRDPKLPRAADPGPFDAELHYFLFNEETSQKLAAAQVGSEAIQNMATVGVFRDGFRVRMADDWLGLAGGTTMGSFYNLRPKNTVGFFAITNEANSRLVEKSDREGFVDNEAWRGFLLVAQRGRKFANDVLESVRTAYGQYAVAGRGGAPRPATSEASVAASRAQARDAIARVEKQAQSLRTAVGRSVGFLTDGGGNLAAPHVPDVEAAERQLQESLADVNRSIKDQGSALTILVEQNRTLAERNDRLIEAAAVGLSARTLAHEIATYVHQIERSAREASKAQRLGDQRRFMASIVSISGAIRELKKVVATIDPLLPGSRSLKDTFRLKAGIEAFAALRQKRIADAGVSLSVKGDAGCSLRFAETRFNQVLENLLQNSLYWLAQGGSKQPPTITVEVRGCTMLWHDSGRGVREAVEDALFDAYVTDKPASVGRGLGLFIVSAFLESEKCHIVLDQDRNQHGRRYRFRVDFAGAQEVG